MTTATTKGAIDPYADPGTASRTAVKALIMLLITFIMGTLCLQGSTSSSCKLEPTWVPPTRRR